MYARLTTLEGPTDKIDDAIRYTQEQVLPQLQQMDGFQGVYRPGRSTQRQGARVSPVGERRSP
jgi:hypothetical protein